MFRPSRSSSGPPRKQIEELFSLSALWDPKCSQVSVSKAKVYRLNKLNLLYDDFNLLLFDTVVY
jgi:hypothetical protein